MPARDSLAPLHVLSRSLTTLDEIAYGGCGGLLSVVALTQNQRLHVCGCHVLERFVAKRREDLFVEVATDAAWVPQRPEHHVGVIALRKLAHAAVSPKRQLRELLLPRRGMSSRHLPSHLVALVPRILQAHVWVSPQSYLLELAVQAVAVAPSHCSAGQDFHAEAASVRDLVTPCLGLQRLDSHIRECHTNPLRVSTDAKIRVVAP